MNWNFLIIFLAEYLIFIMMAVAGVFFLLQPMKVKKKMLVTAVAIGLVAYVLEQLVSSLYYNPRPFVIDHIKPLFNYVADNGFPSDHTALAGVIATIVWFYNRKLGLILGICTILIGVARVLAGVHHVIDIIASVSIVLITAAAYIVIAKRIKFLTPNQ